MPKPSNRQTAVKARPEENTPEHFRAFLAAADGVALELLIREGILTDPRIERSFYEGALERLAKEFVRDFATTDEDDCVHMQEHEAKADAAHMIGLALGLRLRGVDLTGGAR